MTKGIDVSKYQGRINFDKVKKSGYKFVILNAGYGKFSSQKDPSFEENYTNARKAGLYVGAYWYSYAETKADAELEADVFLKVIKGKKFEYPVCFDIEDRCQTSLSQSQVGEIVTAFCNKCEKAGYYVCVYSYASFLNEKIPENVRKRYDIWVAHYGVEKPSFSGSYGMWQYTSSQRIDGIETNTDCDYSYKDYPAIMKAKGLNGFSASSSPVLEEKGYKYGDKSAGVYALKALLEIAHSRKIISTEVSGNTLFDKSVQTAVNEYLSKKKYAVNGIAGEKFIRLLKAELT